MTMLTIDDLRSNREKTGFRYVRKDPRPRPHPFTARKQVAREDRPGSRPIWNGPWRATPEEAAQDYCDHVNGRELAPKAEMQHGFLAHVHRLRYDDLDLGPRDHVRVPGHVTGRHRAALERIGPVDGEFKPNGVGYDELLLAVAKELARRYAGRPELGIVLESAPDPDFAAFAASLGVKVTAA